MEEEEVSPVYVRKARKPYSGMVLDSIFGLLIKSIGVILGSYEASVSSVFDLFLVGSI